MIEQGRRRQEVGGGGGGRRRSKMRKRRATVEVMGVLEADDTKVHPE